MKIEDLVERGTSLLVIVAAILRISNVEHANTFLVFSLLASTGAKSWVIAKLKSKITKEFADS